MENKSWSYQHITKFTEDFIRVQSELADSGESAEDKRTHRLFAVGAQIAWSLMTSGWQQDGDADRLKNLAQNVGRPPAMRSDGDAPLNRETDRHVHRTVRGAETAGRSLHE